MAANAAQTVMDLYPRIYFACHTRHVRDSKTGASISAHQSSVLHHLDEFEATGVLELAKHMGVTASTMSLTVDRLVRGKYVLRGQDPHDARRVLLRLTKNGVRVKRKSSVLDSNLVEAMLKRLSKAECVTAIDGLTLLARAASELVRDSEFKKLTGRAS